MPTVAPYGAWTSPVTSALLTSKRVSLGQVHLTGEVLYWTEGRPLEGGRYVLVRRGPDEPPRDVTPPGFNVRTRVHEYGGGACLVHGEAVTFANFSDQRLYRQAVASSSAPPRPLTPEPAAPGALRYADVRAFTGPDGAARLVAVRERHEPATAEPKNELVALPADGSAPPRVLASGNDFYAAPRPSPDGRRLAWLTWNHPDMPWDATELWVADLTEEGGLDEPRRVAGGAKESILQPEWSPEGRLHLLSDRSGWWNLYAVDREGEVVALAPVEAECGQPLWTLDPSTYAFLSGGRIACLVSEAGRDHVGILAPGSRRLERLELPFTSFSPELRSDGDGRLACVAGSPTQAPAVVLIDAASGAFEVVKRSLEVDLDAGYLSEPRPLAFPTEGGERAHALYYPPKNGDHRAPPGERPPLLVLSHGGPTSSTSSNLSLQIQFWTSRGFAVVDVDYGGSSGYGRAYRERLRGRWGIVDVADCIAAARYLEQQGLADGARMAIRGGSAGGYTTLCALVFHDVFAAGASYFGVADLEGLARDTHKFESRYLDGLIGPYPERKDLYEERSPVHSAERLSCPVILLQGLEDKVVPPAQAEVMVAALEAKGLPYAYLTFPDEQHGFRAAESIQRAIEAELGFYGKVFGFTPAGDLAPVEVHNL